MQLIVDAAASIDIEINMSTINEDSLNEKFSTKMIESFSNNGFAKVGEAKDRINGFIETTKESLKNEEIDKNLEDKKISLITTYNEEEKRDDIDKECSNDNTGLKSSLLSIEDEVIDVDSNVTNDNTENEGKELMAKGNTEDMEGEQIVESEHNNVQHDAANKKSLYIIECANDKVKEVSAIDVNNKINDSNTENVDKNDQDNEVSNNATKTNNEDQNSQSNDNEIMIDSQNKDDVSLISSDISTEIFNASIELSNNTSENEENSKSEMFSDPEINVSQNNKESNNVEDYYKGSVIEIDQMDDVLESELSNVKNTEAKKINGDERDTQIRTSEPVEKEKLVEIEEKLDNKYKEEEKKLSLVYKLSNTLDILSDEEDEKPEEVHTFEDKQCINLVDDDDIMLVDEKTSLNNYIVNNDAQAEQKNVNGVNQINQLSDKIQNMDANYETGIETCTVPMETSSSEMDDTTENVNMKKPLLPSNFLKTCKKNLAEMSREDLEEFCILKIVESVVDRSSLGDIRTQLKNLALTVEEYKKKALMLIKQNRDLQVVLKSVQEEQKKGSTHAVTPLKITRSVGMQVFMADKPNAKKKKVPLNTPNQTQNTPLDKPYRNAGNQKPQKSSAQQIPVPRLVLAANATSNKSNAAQNTSTNIGKPPANNLALTNGVKTSPAVQKPEKRARMQSVTVDLTDDEPPSKVSTRGSPVPPVRLVPAQNLLGAPRPQFPSNINSPRKVYIPISSQQAQNIRPGQTIMLKSVTANAGPKQKTNNNNTTKPQPVRTNRLQYNRHPAPLPDVVKQYQPPNWKALPPAPDLKLSKVDNGIVISWKIEGYKDDSYEEITSYQLYAYQETQCPPSTALWKKIGDVKALPLPMACTLTQFLTGHKYYFAVRAVDIKSRFGPFSIPGSILLLNKI